PWCIRLFFLLPPRRPPSSTLFPYTMLFRSGRQPMEPGFRSQRNAADFGQALYPPEAGVMALRLIPSTGVAETDDEFHDRPMKEKDRKSTRLNSSQVKVSYAVFCLKKKNKKA